MRVLFYTAVAVAATIASVGDTIKIQSSPESFDIMVNDFAQIDVHHHHHHHHHQPKVPSLVAH